MDDSAIQLKERSPYSWGAILLTFMNDRNLFSVNMLTLLVAEIR